MSLTTSLSAAVSGLAVNQRGLEIASHNISNAHTEGYSRRVLQQEARDGAAGGGGVEISGIQRATDTFLTQQVRTEVAALGKSEVRDRYLANTQDLFGSIASDNSVGQRLADLATKMEALAVSPESPTAAADLIEQATGFAREMNAISARIVELRRQADIEIGHAIDELNTDLQIVADMNEEIARGRNVGGVTDLGDLEDQRDQALKRIGEKIGIKTFERPSGEIVVFTGDARTLVDGDARTLSYTPSTGASLDATFQPITTSDGVPVQSEIRDGVLKGLLEVRDRLLPDLHRQMDAIAVNARDMANAAHNRGMGLPAANTLTGSRAIADPATAQVTIAADVRFVVAEANGIAAASFDLPAGTYTVDGLAAAIDAGLGGDGSAAIVEGRLVISAADPDAGIGVVDLAGGADAGISFDEGAGPAAFQGFSSFFGLNDFFQTPGSVQGDGPDGAAGELEVRADLIDNPERIARGRLSTDPAPPVAGTDRAIAAGDSRTMQDLAATFAAERSIGSVGGLPAINKPLHEYAAEVLGLNSQLAAKESERLAFQEALVEQFQSRLTDKAGVNIDEELANILVLQTAFSASARVITTANEMMQTITDLKR